MKKIFLFSTLVVIFSAQQAFGQQYLSGVVKVAGNPIKDLIVYTTFGPSVKTDDLGKYTLDITGCRNCKPGDKIEIYTYKEEIGSSVQSCVISNDYQFNFSVSSNPEIIFVTGFVQNVGNDEPLEGIEVKIVSGDIKEQQPVKTNSFGQFIIPVSLKNLENKNSVRIMAKDPNKVFKPLKPEPEVLEITGFNIIRMKAKTTTINIKVSGFTKTSICLSKGNMVTITATGQIRVGNFVGNSTPEGLTAGVLGFGIGRYNIVKSYNHAVLMYRFEDETEWKVAGKQINFKVMEDGCLEFQINDNKQEDNYGSYDVRVTVEYI